MNSSKNKLNSEKKKKKLHFQPMPNATEESVWE